MIRKSNVKLLLIGIIILLKVLSCTFCNGQIYVDIQANGINDGSSWKDAYNNLHLGLEAANEGDEIWIAAGTYVPDKTDAQKNSTFQVKKGIQLYGGFAGYEVKRSERNPAMYPTILSSDLNQDDIEDDFKTNRNDNFRRVMVVQNHTNVALIDGLVFKSGHAKGDQENFAESSGGGLLIYGSSVVKNCSFFQNYSSEGGGALSVMALEEEARVMIDSCIFSNNLSSFTGGAIALQCYGNRNSITIQNSTFSDNQAKANGGAILMYNGKTSANNLYNVKNCVFNNNSTTEHFIGQAEGGGAIYIATAGKNNFAYIQTSDFLKNSSTGFGGAIGIRNKKPGVYLYAEVNNCHFEENLADNGGAIFYEGESIEDSLVVRHCKFIRNSVAELHPSKSTRGGAMHIAYHSDSRGSRAFVEDCIFNNNEAIDGDGGAMAISPFGQDCFTSVSLTSFVDNKSTGNGGAFFYLGTDTDYELKDCTFGNNQALKGGADLYESQAFSKHQFYIFFHAILWFQILYSLLLFLIVKERTSLYYALMLFGISLFIVIVFDSMYFSFFKEFSGNTRDALYQVGVFLSIFGLIKFAQHYLNINQLLPRFKKIVFYFLSIFFLFELVYCSLQFVMLEQVGQFTKALVGFGLMLCFLFGALIPTVWAILTLRKGFKPANYFLLAMIFSGAALSWIVISFFQSGSTAGIPISYIEGLLLFSIITLALADGYRINVLKKEKERAARLSELDIAKTRLYTNITHEFRTPLTVIMGASEQLRGHESEKELIKRNSQQLLELINQMLDLSKLEGGSLTLDVKQGNIIPFVEYLVESFQSLADSKYIRLTFYKEVRNIQMDFDAKKMQQIITNLISNAIKFTESSGKVVVHAKEEKNNGKSHLTLIVRDNGKGIPKDDLPNVFDRFFQVDASDLRRTEGSGIGLALVKELVQLMKGQITVTSEINEGTVFTIHIPISKEATLQNKVTRPNNLLHSVESKIDRSSNSVFFTPTNELPIALLIEDNKDIVSFLRSCLQTKYKIEVAYNGLQGIDKAFDIIPDIIISDVMMPEADGFTVCKTLKEDERTSHIPIILLTAKATQDDKLQGLEAGADAYLTKPFHQEELEIRLQKLIGLRLQLQSYYQNNSTGVRALKNKEDAFIQKLRSIIEEKMEDESFSINELCFTVGLSRMQVHRKLKALTGMPATAFINSVRLQKAYDLLSDTDLNVSEVAYKVGFSNHSYFSKLFSNKFGQTPSEINKAR